MNKKGMRPTRAVFLFSGVVIVAAFIWGPDWLKKIIACFFIGVLILLVLAIVLVILAVRRRASKPGQLAPNMVSNGPGAIPSDSGTRSQQSDSSQLPILSPAQFPGRGAPDKNTKYHPAGTRIAGRYEVASRPLMGGMGIVYLCFDHQEQRPLALKTFKPEYLPDRVARDRFLREGTAWVDLGSRAARRISNRPHQQFIILLSRKERSSK